jgi:hypothetical protein
VNEAPRRVVPLANASSRMGSLRPYGDRGSGEPYAGSNWRPTLAYS